jgi:hypothetical protein
MLKHLWNSFAIGMGAAWILGTLALSIAVLGPFTTLAAFLALSAVLGVSVYRSVSPAALVRGAGLLLLLVLNVARLSYLTPILAASVLVPLFYVNRLWFLAVMALSGVVLILQAIVEFHRAMLEVDPEYRARVSALAAALTHVWQRMVEGLRAVAAASVERGEELRGSLTVWGKRLLRWVMS